jgi:hypothetical protein
MIQKNEHELRDSQLIHEGAVIEGDWVRSPFSGDRFYRQARAWEVGKAAKEFYTRREKCPPLPKP